MQRSGKSQNEILLRTVFIQLQTRFSSRIDYACKSTSWFLSHANGFDKALQTTPQSQLKTNHYGHLELQKLDQMTCLVIVI